MPPVETEPKVLYSRANFKGWDTKPGGMIPSDLGEANIRATAGILDQLKAKKELPEESTRHSTAYSALMSYPIKSL